MIHVTACNVAELLVSKGCNVTAGLSYKGSWAPLLSFWKKCGKKNPRSKHLGTQLAGRKDDEHTPLLLHAKRAIQLLLNNGVDPNQTLSSDGWSLLTLACSSGHLEAVKMLVEHNADVNACIGSGKSRYSGAYSYFSSSECKGVNTS